MNHYKTLRKLITFFLPALFSENIYSNSNCPSNLSALNCMTFMHKDTPLNYKKLSEERILNEGRLLKFELFSQNYPLQIETNKNEWVHTVSIYLPDNYRESTTPILYIDSGDNNNIKKNTIDFFSIAKQTHSMVISVDLVPNQPISFPTNPNLSEDYLVAHTWKLYIDDPIKNKINLLHLPMAMSAIKTMDLVQHEFLGTNYNVNSFIMSGASKRGWAAWLATIADSRVKAIIPIVIDIYNTKELFNKLYKIYAHNWPIALYPYYKENMHKYLENKNFLELLDIEDPIAYKKSDKRLRLNIPKFIISSSGDDFFPPDSIYENYNHIPGKTYLKYVPNSSHFISKPIIENSIISFSNNLNSNFKSKIISYKILEKDMGNLIEFRVTLTKDVKKISLWQAKNETERDFRFACGIKYTETEYLIPKNHRLEIVIKKPEKGWEASFIEITDNNSFVQTTPNIVLPRRVYPTSISKEKKDGCRVLPL
ncbi:hypothetical protein GCL60_10075 [Silvanigrella paludirubra]|uniref:PhoPQ-regulated protein n=1 Tax=Silvanigrella paludirubra TaxID=2499159 RepID=A0A6N6VT84_9BACT|nr:PhoPQ-activated protein PqaA family protein [Silvanigrella paludirubra]KAB8039190.1 hypothetical protein GCL60_10075 [Silvanigrella paludirubra]